VVSRLPEDSFVYSFHIGIFRSRRRLRSSRTAVEIREESQIGDGPSSGLRAYFLGRWLAIILQ
ncbi:MAG: hypothetical protein WA423_15520, partial [Candidatus Sulfotelmatobacter sp.]